MAVREAFEGFRLPLEVQDSYYILLERHPSRYALPRVLVEAKPTPDVVYPSETPLPNPPS